MAGHPYAKAKGINCAAGTGRVMASGKVVGRDADCIIIPIRDLVTDKVVAVQCINSEGKKQTFGSIRGYGLMLGNDLDPHLPILIFEGWASAVAVSTSNRGTV